MDSLFELLERLRDALGIAGQGGELTAKYENAIGELVDAVSSDYYALKEARDGADDKLSEMEEHYSAKTGKPLITDNERTALGNLASIIGKRPGDDLLEIF